MYQIIVIDDEPLIARSVSQIIAKTNSSFQVTAIAYDGLSGLEKIKELEPDIVFTDIKMPCMDGLQLVKEVRKQFPLIKTVILSGYDEFEYAKTAMREGVMDYLLKPINRELLAELLTMIENQLDLYYHTKQLELLGSLISHPHHDNSKDIERFLPYNSYLLFMTCAGSYHHISYDYSSSEQILWKSNILYNSASEYIAFNPFWILNDNVPNIKILIIGCTEEEMPSLEKLASQIHSSIDTALPITSVIKRFQDSITKIYPAIVQMSQYLRENSVFSKSMLYNMEENSQNSSISNSLYFLSEETKRYITVLFKQKHFEKLKNNLKEIITSWTTGNIKQILLEENLKQILQLLLESIDLQYLTLEYQASIYDIFVNQTTCQGLLEDFTKIIMELSSIKESNDYKNLPVNLILQEVKEYIDDNYTSAINIQSIASKHGFVAPYLSKLFKDLYGISIKNYILNLRMAKAEELLKSIPPLPLSDIASLTGFSDQFYFSKVFKQRSNMTPIEFRRMINNE